MLSLNIVLLIFFESIQFGLACLMGSEKFIHRIRAYVDKHWNDINFSVFKVDFKNAFNLVSRGAVLQECAKHFPDLLPVAWCYGYHPFLCHPMGQLTSQSCVQQGDPLGPFLFSLVLHKIAGAIKRILSATIYYSKLGILTIAS